MYSIHNLFCLKVWIGHITVLSQVTILADFIYVHICTFVKSQNLFVGIWGQLLVRLWYGMGWDGGGDMMGAQTLILLIPETPRPWDSFLTTCEMKFLLVSQCCPCASTLGKYAKSNSEKLHFTRCSRNSNAVNRPLQEFSQKSGGECWDTTMIWFIHVLKKTRLHPKIKDVANKPYPVMLLY